MNALGAIPVDEDATAELWLVNFNSVATVITVRTDASARLRRPRRRSREARRPERAKRRELVGRIVLGTLMGTTLVALRVRAQSEDVGRLHLELHELASVQLPHGTAVLGGLITANGAIVFWTPSEVWELENWRAKPKRACTGIPIAPRYAVRAKAPVRAAIFDSLTHAVVEVRSGGDCTRVADVRFDSAASLVAGAEDEWVQIVIHRKGPQLVRWARSGNWHTEYLRLSEAVRLGDASTLVARGTRGGVLIGEARFPFRVFYKAPGVDPVALLEPSRTYTRSERRHLQGWIALQPVHLDRGYLQVLADPTSDERRFELYDEIGTKLRESQLEVAMGMLDADTVTRTILALRDAGFPELVIYRWRWRAPKP